jgi:hypothetical protein
MNEKTQEILQTLVKELTPDTVKILLEIKEILFDINRKLPEPKEICVEISQFEKPKETHVQINPPTQAVVEKSLPKKKAKREEAEPVAVKVAPVSIEQDTSINIDEIRGKVREVIIARIEVEKAQNGVSPTEIELSEKLKLKGMPSLSALNESDLLEFAKFYGVL